MSELFEKLADAAAIEDEDIRQEECDEKLREEDTSIGDIAKCFFPYVFEIGWIDHFTHHPIQTELKSSTLLELGYKVLPLHSNPRSISEKSLHFIADLGDDIYKYKNNHPDEEGIEDCDDDIGRSILASEPMSTIWFSCHPPVMDLVSDLSPYF